MKFSPLPVKFTLKDIGSEIIDQLSTDIYSGTGSIVRELVKNAYDAYLALDSEDFEEWATIRQIVISRVRDDKGIGHLLVDDRGIGQSKDDLKANVQISISKKRQELEQATGFRGLGSWAVLGAGSKITITSSKKGDEFENRLVLNVREIYKIMQHDTTLDDILNNARCISFSQRPAEATTHYTNVDIECDGPAEMVNGHEFNRLWPYTDPAEKELRSILVMHCPLPFNKNGPVHEKIHGLYKEIGYFPTNIVLDGESLERSIPEGLTNFQLRPFLVNGQPAAIVWTVDDPSITGEVGKKIKENHCLPGPSLQLLKLNVPIGEPGLYAKEVVRVGILDWFIGEAHIILPDVLPNAGGNNLRDGTAKDVFVEALKGLYQTLEDEADTKSQRISLQRHMEKAEDAAAKLGGGKLTKIQETQEMAKVAKAIEILEIVSKKGPATTQTEQRTKKAAKDEDVAKVVKRVRTTLKTAGLYDRLATAPKGNKASDPSKPMKGKPSASVKNANSDTGLAAQFQARVARRVPELQELGLSQAQIEGVLAIVQAIFEEA